MPSLHIERDFLQLSSNPFNHNILLTLRVLNQKHAHHLSPNSLGERAFIENMIPILSATYVEESQSINF